MDKIFNGKIRLVLTGMIIVLFVATCFSGVAVELNDKISTPGENLGDPVTLPWKDGDWNYWNNTPHMYAIPDGNVGIGTSNPTNMLHIVGVDSSPLLNVEKNGPGRGLRVSTSSACALWVENSGNHGLRITNTAGDGVHITNAGSRGIYVGNSGSWAGYFNGDGYFSGNVGIGTTSPNSPLEVAGIIHSTSDGFKFPDGTTQTTASTESHWASSGNDLFYNDGSVGIGTTGPFIITDTIYNMSTVLPSGRSSLGCAEDPVTGKIYCFGGYDGDYLDEILEYDPFTDNLTVKSSTLPDVITNMGCVASKATNRIYLFGGYNETYRLDTILEYDPVNDTLITKNATLPTPRGAMGCSPDPVTEKIYLFGGANLSWIDEILEYDPINDIIVTKSATLPTARFFVSCAPSIATGKIYLFGGISQTDIHDEIMEYDPNTDTLITKTAVLPERNKNPSCATLDALNRIYVFGGSLTDPFDQIHEYDPVNDTLITKSTSLPSPNSGLGCAASSTRNRIYCFGGYNDNTMTRFDDILEYIPYLDTLLQIGDPGDGSGAIANEWDIFSSQEYKYDISPLTTNEYRDILAKLLSTDVVHYRFLNDVEADLHLGVIAEHAPEEIQSYDGKAISLGDYTSFIFAAIKAQQDLIVEQQNQIEELQNEIRSIKEILNQNE